MEEKDVLMDTRSMQECEQTGKEDRRNQDDMRTTQKEDDEVQGADGWDNKAVAASIASQYRQSVQPASYTA